MLAPVLNPSQKVCAFCDSPLVAHQNNLFENTAYACCTDNECQLLARLIDQAAAGLSASQLTFKIQHSRTCRQAQIERVMAEEKIRKEQIQTAQSYLETHLPEIDPDRAEVVNLPSSSSHEVTVSAERYRTYVEHIRSIIDEALKHKSIDTLTVDDEFRAQNWRQNMDDLLASNPTIDDMTSHLCMKCKGGCCQAGGDHAYLTPTTIYRYLKTHPAMSGEELMALYLSFIPEQSIENSCINQTAAGCTVPRSMRSNTCNGYICESVKGWHAAYQTSENGIDQTVVLQWSYNNWNKLATAEHHIIDTEVIDQSSDPNIVP